MRLKEEMSASIMLTFSFGGFASKKIARVVALIVVSATTFPLVTADFVINSQPAIWIVVEIFRRRSARVCHDVGAVQVIRQEVACTRPIAIDYYPSGSEARSSTRH
jgi:alpha/beta superfamily hydrolase